MQFQCGCGFLVTKVSEKVVLVTWRDGTKESLNNSPGLAQRMAIEHTVEYGHSLTVTGNVKAMDRKVIATILPATREELGRNPDWKHRR